MDNYNFILIFLFVCLNFFTVLIFLYIFYLNIEKKIKKVIEPKFLEITISPESNKIITLGVDIWRLENKLSNLSGTSELEREKIKTSLNRIKKYILDYNLEIKGFEGEKYHEDINIYELKATEPIDKKELDGIIKDTIEPVVLSEGKIIKQAKVIVYKFTS